MNMEPLDITNETTLKIYLFLRTQYPSEVGIRETQRKLNIKSPSTVSYHFVKLEEMEYIKKLSNNQYVIVEKEMERKKIDVPIKLSFLIFKDILVHNTLFILSYAITMSLLSIILLFIDKLLAGINAISGLVIISVSLTIEYRKVKKKLIKYRMNKVEKYKK